MGCCGRCCLLQAITFLRMKVPRKTQAPGFTPTRRLLSVSRMTFWLGRRCSENVGLFFS